MPHINAAAALQICMLLSALPAQYLISQWYGTNSAQRIQVTERIIASWSRFTKSYLSLDAWADRLKLWLSKTRIRTYHMAWTSSAVHGSSRKLELENMDGKSVGLGKNGQLHYLTHDELVKKKNWYNGEKKTKIGDSEAETHSYFAESTHVRSPRPDYVQFSVGQVVVHKVLGYSGVIVGWDVKAKAPEEWLQHKYPPGKQDLKETPHYRILINKVNGFGQSTAYVSEEEITIIVGLEVHHPDLKAHFSRYDGSKYIMQPWLKKIYPHD